MSHAHTRIQPRKHAISHARFTTVSALEPIQIVGRTADNRFAITVSVTLHTFPHPTPFELVFVSEGAPPVTIDKRAHSEGTRVSGQVGE